MGNSKIAISYFVKNLKTLQYKSRLIFCEFYGKLDLAKSAETLILFLSKLVLPAATLMKFVLSKFDTFSIHDGQIARQACLTHQLNFAHFLKKKARKHNTYIHKVIVTILIMEKQNVMSVYSAYSWSSYISHIPYMVWQRRVSSIV